MRRLALTLAAAALLAAPPASADVRVAVDRTAVSTALGRDFIIHTTIRSTGGTPASDVVAHLNVVSLDGKTYVDPEDWSSRRTQYLRTVPSGGATTLTWQLKAVNAGDLAVYVAVLPRDGAGAATTSPTVHVTIADRRTLDSGGILPLAVGMPALLALLTFSLRSVRRRAG